MCPPGQARRPSIWGKRYEVVRGVLPVTPAPRPLHQLVEETLVQPDLLMFPPEEWTGRSAYIKALLLAVEVLSPLSRRADRFVKRRLYQPQHVGTYWIVDPEARVVEVWRPGDEAPDLVSGPLRWQVTPQAPVLEIPLQELFADSPLE